MRLIQHNFALSLLAFLFVGCLPSPSERQESISSLAGGVALFKMARKGQLLQEEQKARESNGKEIVLRGVFYPAEKITNELPELLLSFYRGFVSLNCSPRGCDYGGEHFFFIVDQQNQLWGIRTRWSLGQLLPLYKKEVKVTMSRDRFTLEDRSGRCLIFAASLLYRKSDEASKSGVSEHLQKNEQYLREHVDIFRDIHQLSFQESPSMASHESYLTRFYYGLAFSKGSERKKIEPFSIQEIGDYLLVYEPGSHHVEPWWAHSTDLVHFADAKIYLFHKSLASPSVWEEMKKRFQEKVTENQKQ
ncbi:MAG: hypothetical protein H6727_17925 [Myxococcales bacterium]|nr:hypothetical protein [Myxococcales bacterium]